MTGASAGFAPTWQASPLTSSRTMRTTAVKSQCWHASSGIPCRRRRCSACGNGAGAEPALTTHPQLMMRKAALLYNPDSGGRRLRRQADLESVLHLLRDSGVEAELVLPQSRDDPGAHTREPFASVCDTIFPGEATARYTTLS